jgi:hypothetical protein
MSASTHATVAEVTELAPELATLVGPVLSLLVDVITAAMVEPADWAELTREGHRTLAAHVATTTLNAKAAVGAVTSRKIDKVQENYAASAVSDAELGTTKYGRMHLMLKAMLVSSAVDGETDRGWALDDGRVM